MDVAAWLRALGLEQYAPAFRANDVDDEVLSELTSDDLKSIGVTSVGHRRKLLSAIAALGTAPPTVAQPAATASFDAALATPDAERRQLTVMFCDLVGSTALSTRYDPEDLRELIGDYHRAVSETVGSFDGFVAKYMGDGVLIYFGYPHAHEDDAERAVRAGLAVIEAVAGLAGREALRVRIGIATGLAVVGDLIGAGASQERGVVGETPNLAARVQGLAEPNMLVIADATRRQIGGLFDLADLGPQSLTGFAELQRAWRVLHESRTVSRFDALRSGTTPLVGRSEELDLLLRRWQQVQMGDGKVVLLSGEPGIGKSRLTATLLDELSQQPITRLRYFCSPHHQDSALYPFIGQIERAAGFDRGDIAEARLEKLDALLAQTATIPEDAGLIAELLSLPRTGRYPVLDLTPQRRRQRTLAALAGQLDRLAALHPVLMIFEDAHWADATSLELLDLTVTQLRPLRMLAVVTFRLQFVPPWIGQSQVTSLMLSRLAPEASADLVRRISGNAVLAAVVVDEIVERADGVPLFVEELTKAVLEADEGEATSRVSSVPTATAAVPATLYASLMARLDRLQPGKEIAQIGAAIGREFSYELIASVAGRPQAELRKALDQLSAAGLIFSRGTPPDATYLFKHALVQDVAYGTLLRGRRQELHARTARSLQNGFPDIAQLQPEILAHHFAEAGMPAEAVDLFIEAGERARQRSANAEATAQLLRALKLIPELATSEARAAKELTTQNMLASIYQATKGYGSPDAEAAVKRASQLCDLVEDSEQLMRVLVVLRTLTHVQGNHLAAKGHGLRCLEIAQRMHNRVYTAQASVGLGHTLSEMGIFLDAQRYLTDTLAAYDKADDLAHLAITGISPQMFGLSILSWNHWFLGYPDRAVRAATDNVDLKGQGDPQNAEHALLSSAHTFLLQRNPKVARSQIKAASEISLDQGFAMRSAMARALQGWALSMEGDHHIAVAELSMGLADYRVTGAKAWQTIFLAMLASASCGAGLIREGLRAIAEARELSAAHAEHWWDAELHRIEGDLVLALAGTQDGRAERSYRNAIEIAGAQQAKSWELRAATSIARLWGGQGRRAQAHDLLARVYGWFTEGFDTVDLKEAKALLDELT